MHTTGGCGGNGVYITDATNASRTSLMDIRTRTWHQPTCEKFGIPLTCLPEIQSNAQVYGYVGGWCVFMEDIYTYHKHTTCTITYLSHNNSIHHAV